MGFYKNIGYTENEDYVLSKIIMGVRESTILSEKAFEGLDLLNECNHGVVGDREFKDSIIDFYIKNEKNLMKKAEKETSLTRGILSFSAPAGGLSLGLNMMRKSNGTINLVGVRSNSVELDSFESCENSSVCLSEVESFLPQGFGVDVVRTDSYNQIKEQGFRNVLSSPLSTFSTTINTASMGILKNNLKRGGYDVVPSMIRIEELLNYYKFKLSKPTKRKFNINTEVSSIPNSKNKLLFIGVQGQEIEKPSQNIVLLLDVSGSMYDNMEAVQMSVMTILKKMKPTDTISLVTYTDVDTVIFEGVSASNIEEVIRGLYRISVRGCTHGSAGINMAYEIAEKYYDADGNNKVVLITDGDLNFGITDKDGLKKLIEKKKESGVFLTVLGTGLYNLKDDTLETLAKNGNGSYFTINDAFDVHDCLYEKYDSTIIPIAKDVKAQVEFNPNKVKSYRLLGYENRQLNAEDFRNDKVISEPFGSGSYSVALYELEMIDAEVKGNSSYKYIKVEDTGSDDICAVSVRYKETDSDTSEELSVVVKNEIDFSENLKLAYIIYAVGEYLRDSVYFKSIGVKTVLKYLDELEVGKTDRELEKLELLRKLLSV